MIELALVLFSYLLGSFQPGLLIVRLTHRIDVRNFGSGKTGVTNVLRTAGKKHALVVLLLDVGKGLAVVVLAKAFSLYIIQDFHFLHLLFTITISITLHSHSHRQKYNKKVLLQIFKS